MTYKRINMTSFAVKYGLLIAVACIIYFLIMRLVNMHFEVELSLLNALLVVLGVYLALKAYTKAKDGRIAYLEGLGLSFVTSAIAAFVFASFMALYGTVISDSFLRETNANEFFGEDLSLLTLFGYVLIELLISGFIAGFVFMQWFKAPDHRLSN